LSRLNQLEKLAGELKKYISPILKYESGNVNSSRAIHEAADLIRGAKIHQDFGKPHFIRKLKYAKSLLKKDLEEKAKIIKNNRET
jgi:hypothetical protein